MAIDYTTCKYLSEKAFLGCLIISPDKIPVAHKSIETNELQLEKSRKLYDKILELHSNGNNTDLVTLLTFFSDDKDYGGMSDFIVDCNNVAISNRNFDIYLKNVKNIALNKELRSLGNVLSAKNIKLGEFQNELSEIETKIKNLRAKELIQAERVSFSKDLANAVEKIESEAKSPILLPTGISAYDDLTGGLKKQRIYAIGARPSCGKTSLKIILALNLAKVRARVSFFSLEMSKYEILKRMISRSARINNKFLENPRLGDEDWSRLMKSCDDIADYNLYIHDTVTDIAGIEAQIINDEPDVVFIDYIQLMSMQYAKARNWHQEISFATRDLKRISKEFNIAIVVGSQIGRDVQVAEREPRMSDFKESGGIEENSDICMFLHWPWKLNPSPKRNKNNNIVEWTVPETRKVDLIVAKNRHGQTGRMKLTFEYEYYNFKSADGT